LGGIGPHVDNYDVFLIQLSGTRTWEIGIDFLVSISAEYDNLIDIASQNGVRILNMTKLLEQYNGTTTNIHMEPGDCLYLPPRVMHCGTATSDNCMTLSVGCRAPSSADLITRLSETILGEPQSILETLQQRYAESDNLEEYLLEDSSSVTTSICGIPTISNYLSPDIKAKMKHLILQAVKDALDDEEDIFDPLVGRIVTEPNRGSSFSYPMSLDDMDGDWKNELGVWGNATTAIKEALVMGKGCLRRVEGVAFAWSLVHGDEHKNHKYRMYAHGREPIELFIQDKDLVGTISQLMNRIASGPPLDKQFLEDHAIYLNIKADDNTYNFLLELVQQGLLYGDES
jgi:hypothetical protein